jgi:hypothetical protein
MVDRLLIPGELADELFAVVALKQISLDLKNLTTVRLFSGQQAYDAELARIRQQLADIKKWGDQRDHPIQIKDLFPEF